MLQHNPLVIPVLHILREHQGAISEYDLMCMLEQKGVQFPIEATSKDLELFRKHFFLKNALYQLQSELLQEAIYLRIGLLDISLESTSTESTSTEISEQGEARVRDFYLDWANYDNTGDEDVKKLLNSFWERYFALDQYGDALNVLGLSTECGWPDIQSEYRRLVTRHHPDKGGDKTRFIEIREAYETLRCYYQR
ncbi:MAG TPA: DNA-J related domain-containing protein [Gammaproteobacteria bacterium]